jgi:hypothetical protein
MPVGADRAAKPTWSTRHRPAARRRSRIVAEPAIGDAGVRIRVDAVAPRTGYGAEAMRATRLVPDTVLVVGADDAAVPC